MPALVRLHALAYRWSPSIASLLCRACSRTATVCRSRQRTYCGTLCDGVQGVTEEDEYGSITELEQMSEEELLEGMRFIDSHFVLIRQVCSNGCAEWSGS